MNNKASFILTLIIFLTLKGHLVFSNEVQFLNKKSEKIVYLVNHGWHAGIVIDWADIPYDIWPESNNFKNVRHLEIGWGDKDYYQTPEPHLGIALKAALWPTSSVLHIVAFNSKVTAYFPTSEIIEFRLSNDDFTHLIKYIAASHYKTTDGNSKPIAKGLYGNSQFYLSKQTYHLFKTCNIWTAEVLNAGGCAIDTAFTMTVGGLMSQAKSCGKVIQK